MRRSLQNTRPLADILTVSRALLGVFLAGLGIQHGPGALPLVVLTVIFSWFTDLLDGPLARRNNHNQITWVGKHDAEADLTTSLGVVLYLVFSGYLESWLGAVLMSLLLGLWVFHSHQLAWPIYALPYMILGVASFREAPFFGWLATVYLLAMLVTHWSRMRWEFLPEFFQAIDSLLEKASDQTDKV